MKSTLLAVCLVPAGVQAQARDTALDTSVRYVATEANAPPGSCGCFVLQGAAMDASVPLAPRFRVVVDLAGSTVSRVPSSPRGLSEITLLAGPRYTQPLGRSRVNVQALLGAVRGFDSDFIVTTNSRADTSTNFAVAFGGSLDIPMSSAVRLRAAQVEYLQTNLPNGSDDRQRNIRFGAGLVLRFHLPSNQR